MVSSVISRSESWPGFTGIRNIVIFGDSYSSVTLQHDFDTEYHPNASSPLGVEFPGCTYNEKDRPNWVGHLLTKYCPPPRFNPSAEDQEESYQQSPLLVYNYARGGDQVMGIQRQVQHLFLPTVGQKPQWAPWSSNNSIFVTWVGINDCAFSQDHPSRLKTLFSLQEQLYAAGARNFLFIDLPPVDRSPAYRQRPTSTDDETTFQKWNGLLKENANLFAEQHPEATVLLFSSYQTFSVFLDDPETYGFSLGDRKQMGGSVWVDHLHPTSRVHDIIAHNLSEFLGSVSV